MENNHHQCPCQSAQSYADCCQPYHLNVAHAKTAEALMRSRYSAYTLGLIDYLVQTTLPIQQAKLDSEEMREWSLNTQWDGLKIIKHRPAQGSNQAVVIFEAYYLKAGGCQTHYEESLFVKINKRWYFKDPSIPLV